VDASLVTRIPWTCKPLTTSWRFTFRLSCCQSQFVTFLLLYLDVSGFRQKLLIIVDTGALEGVESISYYPRRCPSIMTRAQTIVYLQTSPHVRLHGRPALSPCSRLEFSMTSIPKIHSHAMAISCSAAASPHRECTIQHCAFALD
jgi:hypothetical protein